MSLFNPVKIFKELEDFALRLQRELVATFDRLERIELPKIHGIYDANWVTPTLENSWVAFGGALEVAAYRKQGHLVYLRGTVKNGSGATATIFTLPVGYRPLNTVAFAIQSNGIFGELRVTSAGVVAMVSGSVTSASLDGIVFSVE